MKPLRLEKIRRLPCLCFTSTSLISLTGCQGAPSVSLMGSFFPGWMLCMALGLMGALLLRQAFIKIGVEPYLGPRPVIYFCLWLLIALGAWLLFFRS
jgi:protein AaeX